MFGRTNSASAEIQSVINLAQGRGKGREDEDYVARRNAVDFRLSLLNIARCVALWVEALRRRGRERVERRETCE